MAERATALIYPAGASAPFIAAQGRGHIAEQLVQIAEKCNVPIVRDIDLSNVLALCDVGEYIPPETYELLAGIFAYLKLVEKRNEEG